jgi:hypothetical protein
LKLKVVCTYLEESRFSPEEQLTETVVGCCSGSGSKGTMSTILRLAGTMQASGEGRGVGVGRWFGAGKGVGVGLCFGKSMVG